MPRGLVGQWVFRSRIGPEACAGPLLSRLLACRGVDGDSATRAFMSPKLVDLHDPSLMPDLDRAAERLLAAAQRGEQIVIYGDYDVDGVTATAILYHMLKAVAPESDVRTYVPHRLEEGYGLNGAAIGELADAGARVIVSVDCGVTARAPAEVARARGVDLIITDHHTPPRLEADLPRAYAVVHPRRPVRDGAQPAYPYGELCGAGVAYKLAWRLGTLSCGGRTSSAIRDLLIQLLAFAALGVIADVVPLVGENRVMAYHGLRLIRQSPFPGLRALVEAAGLAGEHVDELHVGFRLGPRLNACGRMGHAREAVELFTVADEARARVIAEGLTQQNNERRSVENAILEQAIEMAEALGMTGPDRRAIVLAHEAWHAGVVGIVCSRLVERFHRPAILMQQREDGVCSGSGRSVAGFNMHAALEACAGQLEKFGGHDMAAGVHVRAAVLHEFVESFTARANAGIRAEDLAARIEIDCPAAVEELTGEAVGQIEKLAPFGRENPPVRLLLRGLKIMGPPRLLGAYGKHVELHVRAASAGSGAGLLRLVAWNWGERIGSLASGMTVDAVVEPKLNRWNGRVRVEPELRDVAPVTE